MTVTAALVVIVIVTRWPVLALGVLVSVTAEMDDTIGAAAVVQPKASIRVISVFVIAFMTPGFELSKKASGPALR